MIATPASAPASATSKVLGDTHQNLLTHLAFRNGKSFVAVIGAQTYFSVCWHFLFPFHFHFSYVCVHGLQKIQCERMERVTKRTAHPDFLSFLSSKRWRKISK